MASIITENHPGAEAPNDITRRQFAANTPKIKSDEPDPFERHYAVKELSDLWQFDPSTIRQMFQDEPGVLNLGKIGRRDGKRDYVTLRIPESVARRVYRAKLKRGDKR